MWVKLEASNQNTIDNYLDIWKVKKKKELVNNQYSIVKVFQEVINCLEKDIVKKNVIQAGLAGTIEHKLQPILNCIVKICIPLNNQNRGKIRQNKIINIFNCAKANLPKIKICGDLFNNTLFSLFVMGKFLKKTKILY